MNKASLTFTHVDEAARALTRENSEVSVRTVRDFGVTGGSAQMSDLVRDWKAWTRDLLVQVWDMPPDFLAGMQALIHEIKTRADQSLQKALEATVHKCDELIANADARITEREIFFDGERTRLLADAEIGRRAL
ncbi:MAG: DNA-binding protein, partial [Sideroxyarcus sp.]|nr:DNA-binding protein [Sideroxyarcus sp.]